VSKDKFSKGTASATRATRGLSMFGEVRLKNTFLFREQSAILTTLLLTVFTQRNFVADFLQVKCDFRRKSAVLRFEPHFDGLRGNVRRSSS